MELSVRIVSSVLTCLFSIQAVSSFDDSVKCLPLINDIESCPSYMTNSFGHWKDIMACQETGELTAPETCNDSYAKKIIDHQEVAYAATKHFFNVGGYDDAWINDDDVCLEALTRTMTNWIRLIPELITEKRCRDFKMHPIGDKNRTCIPIIDKYIDLLYSLSFCPIVEAKNPNDDDEKSVKIDLISFVNCLDSNQLISSCPAKSDRFDCVEAISTASTNKNSQNLRHLDKNMVVLITETDKLLCDDQHLRSELETNPECLKYVNKLSNFLLSQMHGFQSCQKLKDPNTFTTGMFEGKCRPILQKFWIAMRNQLPCAEPSQALTSEGVKIYVSPLMTILTLFSGYFSL